MRAIERYDIAVRFGGDLSRAAKAVRGRMLLVYTPDDRMVSADPNAEFARLTGARTLVVPSDCGHSVFWCDATTIGATVRQFIARR
jgi:homoserine acetyltransferase